MSTQSQTLVLNALLERADEHNRVAITDTELAAAVNRSRRAVQYAIRYWKDQEVITSELYGDRGTKRTLQLATSTT